jgi:hypothetical protein
VTPDGVNEELLGSVLPDDPFDDCFEQPNGIRIARNAAEAAKYWAPIFTKR